jgi:hypothetical protein
MQSYLTSQFSRKAHDQDLAADNLSRMSDHAEMLGCVAKSGALG